MSAGLPLGGLNWTCHLDKEPNNWGCFTETWICDGETKTGASPPGGCGWACEKRSGPTLDPPAYRCTKPEGAEDRPPGIASHVHSMCTRLPTIYAVCEKGSALGGTVCRVSSSK